MKPEFEELLISATILSAECAFALSRLGVLEPEAAKLCASEVKNMADVMERLLKDTDSSQGIVRLPQLLRRKARAMADADAENRSALREPALAPIRLRAAS